MEDAFGDGVYDRSKKQIKQHLVSNVGNSGQFSSLVTRAEK